MRKYIMPILPDNLFTIADFSITKDLAIMIVFAILMIVASFSMIKKEILIQGTNSEIHNKGIVLKGTLAGVLTGFVGVGGGFLIIPTLLFSANLPMRKAVITSLLIITFNSLFGFAASLNSNPIDWGFLIKFTGFAVVGILIGMYLSQKISNEKLKPIFGWFILIMGIYILIKETFI